MPMKIKSEQYELSEHLSHKNDNKQSRILGFVACKQEPLILKEIGCFEF